MCSKNEWMDGVMERGATQQVLNVLEVINQNPQINQKRLQSTAIYLLVK